MRIVIIADVMDTGLGGMKTYADNLVRCIPEVDTENEYFIINHKRSDKDRNLQFVAIPYTRYPGKFFIRKFFHVPKKIRSLNPDVVMETTHMGPFFLSKKVKRVTVIHDLSTFIYPEHYTWTNRMAERLLLPGILKQADYLITVSNSTKNDLVRLLDVNDEKVMVIPLGVEEVFRPTIDHAVLNEYGITQPFILHVGTLQPRKNIEMLIDAYEIFREHSILCYQLVLIGKVGWKASELLHKIRMSKYCDDILITGHVLKEELPVLYSMCKLFVLPSHYEGFGLPLAEALACGARCLAADNSSLREVGGDQPHYFKNLVELTELMSEVINSKENSNGSKKGFDKVIWDWSKNARLTMNVLTAN